MNDLVQKVLPDNWTSNPAELPTQVWIPVLVLLVILSSGPLVLGLRLWWRLRLRSLFLTGAVASILGWSISASSRPIISRIWDWLIEAWNQVPSLQVLGANAMSGIVGWLSGAAGALFVWFFLWALMDDGRR